MNYLFYQLNGFQPCYHIRCSVIDPESYKIETDFDKFINYKGPLTRVVFLEEYSIGRASEVWYDKRFLNQNDIIWIGNFGYGSFQEVFEKFKKIIDANSVNYDMVHILTNSEYEFSILDKVFKNEKPNYSAVHYSEMAAIEEMLNSQKPKRFTFLSRNFNNFRFLEFLDLRSRGVISNSYFSFFNIKNIYKNREDSYSYYDLTELSNLFYNLIESSSSQTWKNNLINYWESSKYEIFKQLPCTLHGERDELGENPGLQVISSTLRNAYTNSHFSLIPETYIGPNDDLFQCTEKTIKAIIHQHPFMVYSNPQFLKRMKIYGFKSFGEFIDESYDDISDPFDRIAAINDQAEYLNNLNYYEFKKIMWNMSDIVMYNYQVILDRIKNPMARIKHNKYNSTLDSVLMKSVPQNWYNNSYNANN